MEIEGYDKLVEWFGEWPSFHDAEIIYLHLNRDKESSMKIHTWKTTDKINEKGQFVTDKHVVVTFTFRNILDLELYDFSVQNVISDLTTEETSEGYRLTLDSCSGLAGSLDVKDMNIEFQPIEYHGERYQEK